MTDKAQRKQIDEAATVLDERLSTLIEIRDDLQTEFDEMSERRQESERGEALSEEIDTLTGALDELENAIATLREIAVA